MTRTVAILALSFLAGLLAPSVAHAASAAKSVIQIPYGITKTKLTGDGLNGTLVMAWRDNGNAHGFAVLTIYAEPTSPRAYEPGFLLVPVFEGQKEKLELTPSGGADCRLNDFRLVREPGHDLQLIIARRDFGKSYADPAPVTFEYFILKHNADIDIGRPDYYFDMTQSVAAKRAYCDVNDAFKHELGLGSYWKDATK